MKDIEALISYLQKNDWAIDDNGTAFSKAGKDGRLLTLVDDEGNNLFWTLYISAGNLHAGKIEFTGEAIAVIPATLTAICA